MIGEIERSKGSVSSSIRRSPREVIRAWKDSTEYCFLLDSAHILFNKGCKKRYHDQVFDVKENTWFFVTCKDRCKRKDRDQAFDAVLLRSQEDRFLSRYKKGDRD